MAAASTDDFPALVADLYARWTLDALSEIAYAVSGDLVVRPHLYQSDDIPDAIVSLRMSLGTSPELPNAVQRQAMLNPILGRSDGARSDAGANTSSFYQARKKLLDAAVAFSERAVDTGLSMLEDRVRSALVPLRAHFDGLRGKSVRLSAQQIKAQSKVAVDVLTSPGIARVFGVVAAEKGWPFGSTDANGAKLVEAAGTTLSLGPDHRMNYTRFILLQRVAVEGGRALATALGPLPDTSKDLQTLVSQLYTWGASLRDFQQTP
jgi:hypothetical protein